MLRVNYKLRLGSVRLPAHSLCNIGEKALTCPIYACNGLFAAVWKKRDLIFFATDSHHLRACLGLEGKDPDNLFKGMTFRFDLSKVSPTIRKELLRGFNGCKGCKVIFEEGDLK